VRAINLLPRDDKRRGPDAGKPSPIVLTAIIGAVLVTALLCGLFLMAHSKVTQKQAALDGKQQELGAIPKPATDVVARADAIVADKQARISALNAALARRVAWDRVLREFALVLPSDVWLMKLSGEPPTLSTALTPAPPSTSTSTATPAGGATTSGSEASPTAGSDGSVMFQIEGFTYSQGGVARLLTRLQVIPDFENVQLLSSEAEQQGGRNIIHFRLGADIRQPGGAS
jgi:Tfp pilus assembly protein PilN